MLLICTSVQSVGVFVGGYGILPYPRHPLKSSHRIHRIHRSFWRRVLPRISQMLTEVYGVGFSHGFHRIHRNDCRRIFSHRFRRFSRIFRLRFCLLICVHPCLSVGGTSLPECSVCSVYSVGHSLCLLCWCCRGSCTSVVVFSHGFHEFPQMVRLRYWRRGYGRDAIPS